MTIRVPAGVTLDRRLPWCVYRLRGGARELLSCHADRDAAVAACKDENWREIVVTGATSHRVAMTAGLIVKGA